MSNNILSSYIRKVTETDRKKLPQFSYSKMEVYKNCPLQYSYKYNQFLLSKDTTLALELGTLCHLILELKGRMIAANKPVDYDSLTLTKLNGYDIIDGKQREVVLGEEDLKRKYWEEWYVGDNASGMNYEEKMQVFDKVLHSEMENDDWEPYLFEHNFEFVWDNRCIFHGFIDRVDKKGDDFRVVDYKTSKKVYDKSKLSTSLQFGIYCLAILNEFGRVPVENLYRFVLIDEKQKALTKGWEKRLIKAINKVLDSIDKDTASGIWTPRPCPLCHWCNYSTTNPKASDFKNVCDYYSLWTPENKTFKTNKVFNPTDSSNIKLNSRELFF